MKHWLARQNAQSMEFSLELLSSDESKRIEELREATSGRDFAKQFGGNPYEAEVIRIVGDLVEVKNLE